MDNADLVVDCIGVKSQTRIAQKLSLVKLKLSAWLYAIILENMRFLLVLFGWIDPFKGPAHPHRCVCVCVSVILGD